MAKQATFFLSPQQGGGTENSVPPVRMIPSFCQVLDTRKGKSGKTYIRYLPYEQSIWVDEQNTDFNLQEIKHADSTSNVVAPSIKFYEGKKIVSLENDKNLVEYLRTCIYNEENARKNNFRGRTIIEYRPDKIAKESLQRERAELDVTQSVMSMPFKMLINYACILDVIPSTLEEDLEMDADELRYRMVQIAKRDPDAFVNGLDDELYKYKSLIMDCISLGILNKEGAYSLRWSNGERFVSVPDGAGTDAVIELAAEKLQADQEKEKFIKLQIKKQRGNDIIETIKNNVELEPDVFATYSTDKIFKLAKEDGIIERSGAYYKLGDTRLSIDDARGESAAIEFLKENPHVLEDVRKLLKG